MSSSDVSPSPSPVHAVPAAVHGRPKISFGDTPDLSQLVAERLGRQDDKRTYCDSLRVVTFLEDWDQLSTPRKVWAVVWRFFATLTGIIPLTCLLIAAPINQYLHNNGVTLDASLDQLTGKTWKKFSPGLGVDQTPYLLDMETFQDKLWNRLEAELSQDMLPGVVDTPEERNSHFARGLANINMELFLQGILVDLEKGFKKQKEHVPIATKMRMAYDIMENLWARYKDQMEHYPWLEDPDQAGKLRDSSPAAAILLYQRMGMSCVYQKYFIYQYADSSNTHRPPLDEAYFQASEARRKGAPLVADEIADKTRRNQFALGEAMGFHRPIMVPLSDKKGAQAQTTTADLEERMEVLRPAPIQEEAGEFFRTLDPFANSYNSSRLTAASDDNTSKIRALEAYRAELALGRPDAALNAAEKDQVNALAAQYKTEAFVASELDRVDRHSPRGAALILLQQQIAALAAMPQGKADALAGIQALQQQLQLQVAGLPRAIPANLNQDVDRTHRALRAAQAANESAEEIAPKQEAYDAAFAAVADVEQRCTQRRKLEQLIAALGQQVPIPPALAADFADQSAQHAVYLALLQQDATLPATIDRLAKIEAAKRRVEILTEENQPLVIDKVAVKTAFNRRLGGGLGSPPPAAVRAFSDQSGLGRRDPLDREEKAWSPPAPLHLPDHDLVNQSLGLDLSIPVERGRVQAFERRLSSTSSDLDSPPRNAPPPPPQKKTDVVRPAAVRSSSMTEAQRALLAATFSSVVSVEHHVGKGVTHRARGWGISAPTMSPVPELRTRDDSVDSLD